jgi:hypothetical protein
MNYFEIFDRWNFNFSSSELYKSMESTLPTPNSTENPDSQLILRILKFLANLEETHDVIQHDDQIIEYSSTKSKFRNKKVENSTSF